MADPKKRRQDTANRMRWSRIAELLTPHERTVVANALTESCNKTRETIVNAEAEIAAKPEEFKPFPASLKEQLLADADLCEELVFCIEQ